MVTRVPLAAALLIVFTMPVNTAHAEKTSLSAGSACKLTHTLEVSRQPSGRGRKARLNEGADVTIADVEHGWAHISSASGGGYVKLRKLTGICKTQDAQQASEAPAAEPEPLPPIPPLPATAPPPVVENGAVETSSAQPTPSASSAEEVTAQPASSEPSAHSDAAPAPGKITLAVMDLVAKGVSQDIAANVGQAVTTALGKLGPFSVLSRQDIVRMLEYESAKQQLSCDEMSCIAEIGGALGAEYIVSGNVGKVGDTFVLALQLINIRRAKVIDRESREVSGDEAHLLGEARGAAKRLVSKLLQEASGFLVVRVGENDAEVEIDDDLVGVTPLRRMEFPGGTHRVKVNKEGFVVWAQDVDIQPKQTAVADVTMVPSPEYVEAYETRATAYRWLAWSTSLLGAAGTVGGFGMLVLQEPRRKNIADDIKLFNAGTPREDVTRGSLQQRIDRLDKSYMLYQAVGFSGLALLGAATYFWLAGDDPGRYEEFRAAAGPSVSAGMSIDVIPSGQGATMTLGWGF